MNLVCKTNQVTTIAFWIRPYNSSGRFQASVFNSLSLSSKSMVTKNSVLSAPQSETFLFRWMMLSPWKYSTLENWDGSYSSYITLTTYSVSMIQLTVSKLSIKCSQYFTTGALALKCQPALIRSQSLKIYVLGQSRGCVLFMRSFLWTEQCKECAVVAKVKRKCLLILTRTYSGRHS